jgi:hypothetical protein
VAKLVEVTVFKPTSGKMRDALATCAEVKSYLLKNGVDGVWYNTGTVGRHFGCIISYQVYASGEVSGKVNDSLNVDKQYVPLLAKMNSQGEFTSHDSHYQTNI